MRRWLVLSLFLLASVGVTVWVTGMDRIGVMTPFTYEEIFLEIRVHLLDLVFPSVLIATVIAVLVGILITRTGFKRLGSPIMAVASAAMSIPSMGVLAIMVPVLIALGLPGYGILPALVALVTWGVLPILRNTYAGINNISPGILEAARGMGMTRGQIARRIELPLALPVIMAGIRITTVILVGTAALAVIVGAGGLGRIILAGVNNRVPLITLQGAAPVAAIAIILSTILAYVERRLTPRGMRIETAF
jgi:osmoprotectant transport system permease protein